LWTHEAAVDNAIRLGFGNLRDCFLGLEQDSAGGTAGRAAIRAELKGLDCKMWIVPNPWYDPCNMSTHNDIVYYDTKFGECVRRGAPDEKQASSRTQDSQAGGPSARPPSFFAITIAPFAAMLDRLLRLEEFRSASALQYTAEHSMKKEELEVILGDGENTPDLGPIEDYLYAVATERKLPDFAVGMCTLRFEEAAPKLRAVLLRAADGEVLSDDESLLLFRGLHILGGARGRAGCKLSPCWASATWCRSSTVPFVKTAYPKNGLTVLSSMRTLPWRNTRPTTSIDSRNTTSVTSRTCSYRCIGRVAPKTSSTRTARKPLDRFRVPERAGQESLASRRP
jgi:hypothetical protein